MNKEITAVILAGGRGHRMGELTLDRQKCMLPINGRPILEHIFDNIHTSFGSAKVVIATGHRSGEVQSHFQSRYKNISIEYVYSQEHLETRKRLQLAENSVSGPFLYLAGDVISDPSQLQKVAESYELHKKAGVIGAISGATDHQPALSHAIISTNFGHAVEMIYPPTADWKEDQVREMGIAYFDNRFFYLLRQARKDQTYLSHVISEAITKGTDFAVETYFDRWYHFLRPDDLNTEIDFTK